MCGHPRNGREDHKDHQKFKSTAFQHQRAQEQIEEWEDRAYQKWTLVGHDPFWEEHYEDDEMFCSCEYCNPDIGLVAAFGPGGP